MKWYCEKCRKMHSDNEMCPSISRQLKKNPELLTEAANFTTIASKYALVSSNALVPIAEGINKIAGTNFSYEGTHQYARDIQIFKRLNIERYCNKGYFNTPDLAKQYIENANPSQMSNLRKNLSGVGQEVDWARSLQGKLSSLLKKSELYNKNKPGVDGCTSYRWINRKISETTIKSASTKGGLNTNAKGIIKSLKNDTLKTNDIVYGIKGIQKELRKKIEAEKAFAKSNNNYNLALKFENAKKDLKIKEQGNFKSVKESSIRLEKKIRTGEATTKITTEKVMGKMQQGAVIGAVVGLTVSSITNYVRHRNGELSQKEAFAEVSEESLKSAIIGAEMATLTIFIPGGAIGFIAGMTVGIYLNAVCTNILDEIYGKGAYGAILNSSGYVYGMTSNLGEYLEKIESNMKKTQSHITRANVTQKQIKHNFDLFEQMKGE